MESDSPVVYHGSNEPLIPKDVEKHIQRLTPEESEIFRACNRESLYYRCLPLGLLGMAATQVAVKKGILSAHPVWGSTLKLCGAAFVGWIVGKISYRRKCEDKFLTLENSPIGDIIRKHRGYIVDRDPNDFTRSKTAEDDAELKESYTTYSDDYHSSSGSLNLDVDKNIQYSGLDDRERPSTDREVMTVPENIEPVRNFTTYEDLRRRNREEYDKSQRSYTRPDQTLPPLSQRPWSNVDNPPTRRYSTDPNEGESKNKYGDSWDNSKFL